MERSKTIKFNQYICIANFNIIKCKKALVRKNQIYNYKRYIFAIKYKITKESNIYIKYKSNNKSLKKLKIEVWNLEYLIKSIRMK